ncbi:DUF3823 domain-containing protein [Bacteroides sp. 519]|uniref:DUF3823 domain-containing protein n=1 Tax=Bacteroides sp. 519 TaxID=2302937 RepID=UPI0013D25BA1|nr:DUF3823 domain-containing protein [Bacteroides sp. 519]NDV60343.1 DUF3823 domain-containing protein [Bacteroides sp. 519]
MKKLIYSLFVGASAFLMASCMGIDNFDAPDAHFTGRIIDSTTGKNILADQGECRVRIWEKSFSLNPAHQDIPVKQDGEFNNNKLFKGTYDVVPEGAWWPADTIRVGIGKKTVENFEVTPYLTLFDFTTELVGDSLFMTCRLDAPKKEGLPQIMEIRPYLSLNQFCGAANCIGQYNNNDHKVNIMKTWDKLDKEADGKSIKFTAKAKVKPGYIYFVRMGAKVRDTHEKFNYTEIKMIEVPQ